MTRQARGSRPRVIAHRGGAALWPENTLHAFEHSLQAGADAIELDVRSTADGALIVLHDFTLMRTTDGAGAVSGVDLADLRRLDAAYHFSIDGGRTYPLRGRGLRAPTLDEVFEAFPEARIHLDPKQESPPIDVSLCRAIREHKMADKILVGSFHHRVLEDFRRACPEVATSASPLEVRDFLTSAKARAGTAHVLRPQSYPFRALQIPEYWGGTRLLSESSVGLAHGCGFDVYGWTVNDVAGMRRLLSAGVDGLVTDRPDEMRAVVNDFDGGGL